MPALTWRPLHDQLGAEVDLDLTRHIPPDVATALVALLDERQVLVFRDQDVDLDQQVALAQVVAPVVDDPPVAHTDAPAITGRYITNVASTSGPKEQDVLFGGELLFHTEFSYLHTPIYGLSLWGESVPDDGPATLYLSNRDAYGRLPADLRERLADLHALHAYLPGHNEPLERYAPLPEGTQSSVHPLVYLHPRTGEPVLYCTKLFTHSVVELDEAEGRALLAEIEAATYAPQFVLAHRWRPRDLVIWDNISVQHARENVELDSAPRRLRRVTVGDPSRYATPAR